MKRNATIRHALCFDHVSLIPAETGVKPAEVALKTRLTKTLSINIPLISAPRADVTEAAMAITMAQHGGLGVIHGQMPAGKQVEEVRRVKRHQGPYVREPITIAPDSSIAEALDLMTTYKISGLPVIEQPSKKVVGIITNRDLRFFEDYTQPVSSLMTHDVVTAKAGIDAALARQMLHQNRIEKLVLVDDQGRCAGLITVKDIEKNARWSMAASDKLGRLMVGAAVGTGKEAVDRTLAMVDAGLDVVFVDAAHAHARDVANTVSMIRQQRSAEVQVIAGNVATAAAARSLSDAGADAVKVGVGFSSASALRQTSGTGIPQMQAVLDVAAECDMLDIPMIVDGGMINGARIAKALAAGGNAIMLGCLLAGSDEAPGTLVYKDGKTTQVTSARAGMSKDVYDLASEQHGEALYHGSAALVIDEMLRSLRAAMAYSGARDVEQFRANAEFVRFES